MTSLCKFSSILSNLWIEEAARPWLSRSTLDLPVCPAATTEVRNADLQMISQDVSVLIEARMEAQESQNAYAYYAYYAIQWRSMINAMIQTIRKGQLHSDSSLPSAREACHRLCKASMCLQSAETSLSNSTRSKLKDEGHLIRQRRSWRSKESAGSQYDAVLGVKERSKVPATSATNNVFDIAWHWSRSR